MDWILNSLILFILGSFLGWFIELIHNTIVYKKFSWWWGFFKAPFKPVWGFGLIITHTIAMLSYNLWIKAILFLILLNLHEYLSGVITYKLFNRKLWDYRDEFLNISGFICLKVAIYWLILGIGYTLFITKYINYLLNWVNNLFSPVTLYISMGMIVIITIIMTRKTIIERLKIKLGSDFIQSFKGKFKKIN